MDTKLEDAIAGINNQLNRLFAINEAIVSTLPVEQQDRFMAHFKNICEERGIDGSRVSYRDMNGEKK